MNSPSSREHAVHELVQFCDSRLFKSLAEPVRVEILGFLILNGRSDIASIAAAFTQDRSVISRHLNTLADAGILRAEKQARHIFYELDGNALLGKFEHLTGQIRECMQVCCPPKQ